MSDARARTVAVLGGGMAGLSAALRERYELATALDAQRLRMWEGDAVDPMRRDGNYALFSVVAAAAAALVDPEVFRVAVRRAGLLDSTRVLDDDVDLQRRIERIVADLLTSPRQPAGPTRAEMVALVAV